MPRFNDIDSDNYSLEIDLNEDYSPKFEAPFKFRTSFFKNLYERSANHVSEIIDQNSYKNTDKNDGLFKDEIYSNIVAFVGDRGTGKLHQCFLSVML